MCTHSPTTSLPADLYGRRCSNVQFFLPPVASEICYRIQNLGDTSGIQIDDICRIAIDRKHWEGWSLRSRMTIENKASNVLLKGYSNRVADDGAAWPVEECVRHIFPMKGGRYAELICVCLVAECLIEVKGIAT